MGVDVVEVICTFVFVMLVVEVDFLTLQYVQSTPQVRIVRYTLDVHRTTARCTSVNLRNPPAS